MKISLPFIIVMACMLAAVAAPLPAQETSDTEDQSMSFSFPVAPEETLEEEVITEEIQPVESSTESLIQSIAPGSVAAGHELLPPGYYWVRLGFEDFVPTGLGDFMEPWYPTTELLQYGIEFQDLGLDGTKSFGVAPLPIHTFIGINWQQFPPFEMWFMIASPFGIDFAKNTRWINFDQAASYVSLFLSSGIRFPSRARATLKAYDGPFGTGNELFTKTVRIVMSERVVIDVGSYDIRSITIQSRGNHASIDDLVIDSGIAPKGGNIEISSNLDATMPPTFFLDGTPSYLGRSGSVLEHRSISPAFLLSIDEGVHVVTLYTPGYEWHQEHINVVAGQETVVNGNLVLVSDPTLRPEPNVQESGSDIDVGERARPYLIDWNADAVVDLLVGNALGEVLVYLNTNTNADPMYDPPTTVLPSMGFNATPIALQYYHTGMKHLVVGYDDGSVNQFFNTGTDATPAFAGSPFDSTPVSGVGTDAVPCMTDLDGDEKTDLIVGYANGDVYYHPNQRLDASPDFGGGIFLCSVASQASPSAVCDWDGDGLIDLVVGDGDGFLNLFLNEGTAQSPSYSTSTQVLDSTSTAINAGAFAHPLVAYVDDDQIKDILLGKGDGTIKPYLSAITNLPPVADAGGPYEAECAGATTSIALDGTGSSDPDGDALSYSWSSDCPGASFDDATSATPLLSIDTSSGPVSCAVTLTVSDGAESADDAATVDVLDTTPPELTVSITPEVLWPPNHKMIEVVPTIAATDTCDASPTVELVSISMNEGDGENAFFEVTDNTLGDGNTFGDIQVDGDGAIFLRAERSALGDGRVYTLTYKATDAAGNEQTTEAIVTVPHNQ